MKYSAIAQPEYGAMYCIGAGSEADAFTMIVYSMAPDSRSFASTARTVDAFWPIATYTQMTPVPFWLMIVSRAMAVLPMPRSPIISSRWPRPIGIIESTALSPVCNGSLTGWRTMIPGAGDSTLRVIVVFTSPSPSTGRPSGSTTRPISAGPTGTSSTRAVRRTLSPSQGEVVAENDGADVVLFQVEGQGGHRPTRLRRGDLEHLARHRPRQPVNSGDAVADLE